MATFIATALIVLIVACRLTSTHNFTIQTPRLNAITLFNNELAAGCKDTNFCVYDIETAALKWQAKAYPVDELNLKQNVDVVDVKHIADGLYMNLSAYDKIYQYDIRLKRKEVLSFNTHLDPEFTTTCFDVKNNALAVANNIGAINLFDLRNTTNALKKFNDHEGSVKHVKFHPTENKLLSGELIRLI